eukprot:TRINITY_DN82535_c0_g1_i1.p1 TRINITY_DN82535_c0_g1~~TRINITY_DN82535_c0_g1_i1.p1  ORF type:complete len:345 (+),score=55.38 TRINITY_DN82535_c0_g1_i1:30-1037(+)
MGNLDVQHWITALHVPETVKHALSNYITLPDDIIALTKSQLAELDIQPNHCQIILDAVDKATVILSDPHPIKKPERQAKKNEKREPPAPPSGPKTQLCRFYQNGNCRYSSADCPYAHGEQDLQPTEDLGAVRRNKLKEKPSGEGKDTKNTIPTEKKVAVISPPTKSAVEFASQAVLPSSLQHLHNLVVCKHHNRGCTAVIQQKDLGHHLQECVFEQCKDALFDAEPLLKYLRQLITVRDNEIEFLRGQVARTFKEEQDIECMDPEQVELFKDLVFKETNSVAITTMFTEKWPQCEWSCFSHHVTDSDLSYIYDGYFQWTFKEKRYILVKLDKKTD